MSHHSTLVRFRAVCCVAVLVLKCPPGFSSSNTASDLSPYVGWYEITSSDLRLVTYAAKGDLRLISLGENPSSAPVERVSVNSFKWRRKDTSDIDLRFIVQDSVAVRFEWSNEDGVARVAKRSQDKGYDVRELQYDGSGELISASLFVPRLQGTHAVAVMIHGSGDSDRDNLWYMLIAHSLVEKGIAVLFPDKRGCGKSQGDWKTASFSDFADDALAAVSAISTEGGIDSTRIGLLGISQGGWIAPLAATRTVALSFLVNVSGAVVTPNEQLHHELEANRFFVRMAKLRRPVWWEKNGDFNPLPFWAAFHGPSLTLYGAEDEQDNVPVAHSVKLLQELQREHPETKMTIKVFENTGHGFFETGTRRIRRDFLDTLAQWIIATTKR